MNENNSKGEITRWLADLRDLPSSRPPRLEPGRWIAGIGGFLTSCFVGCLDACAAVMAFNLDTNRSVVELRGTVLAFGLNLNLNDQSPGSRLVPWQGTVLVETSTNSIRFLGGNWMPLLENGSWEPDTNGVPGIAPANYGLKPAVNLITIKIEGRAACRQWGFETVSTNLPMQNGEFAMRPVLTRFVADALSAVDYRFVLTLNPGETDLVPRQSPTVRAQEESSTIVAGRAWMSGVLTNRTTLKGSLAHQDGVETLTLPLEGWHSFSTTAAGYSFRFDLILTGQLVGTRIPVVEVEAPTQAGGPLRLSWPPGYRLQRATRLFPPNWTNDAITSPLVIHVLQPAEYFRAIRHDPAPGSGAAIASLQSWEFQRCPVQEGKELSCCERESSKVEVAKPVHNP